MLSPGPCPPSETLDDLYDNAPCGYLTLNGHDQIVRLNATLLNWLRSDRESIIGQNVRDILSPAGRIFLETHVAPLLLAEGAVSGVALDLRCSDNSRVPMLTDWRRYYADGQAIGCRVMLVDASDRRAYERDLIASRNRAEDVADRLKASEAELKLLNLELERRVADRTAERDRVWRHSHDLIVVIDRRWRIKAVNPAAKTLLGYVINDVVGSRFDSFVHRDDLRLVSSSIREAARARVSDFEARLRNAQGEWRRFSWSAAPGSGEAYVIGRDATVEHERKLALEEAQEALRQSQKLEAMGSLTGGVAHDFNNLLTPIVYALERVGRRGITDERERRIVEGASQAAERARVLVQRLLAFARKQPLQVLPVDIGATIEGIAGLIDSTTGPKVSLEVTVEPGLPAAIADANQIEMALLNLAVNARDAMPDGGAIAITAARLELSDGEVAGLNAGVYIKVCVSDNGSGMDEATQVRSMEPFFSTKGVGKGTGLGLSMAHGLAAQLGGKLTIESKVGIGTTIRIYLPATRHAAPSDERDTVRAPRQASGTVLLVDDDALVRLSTAEMLIDIGYSVIQAASSEEALAIATSGTPFDLLVTDHLMPGRSGSELAHELRKARPDLPILIITGYAEDAWVDLAFPASTNPTSALR